MFSKILPVNYLVKKRKEVIHNLPYQRVNPSYRTEILSPFSIIPGIISILSPLPRHPSPH